MNTQKKILPFMSFSEVGKYHDIKTLPLLAVLFMISSCCSPGIKPEDANLFQAACGVSSGDFKRQTDELKMNAETSHEAVEQKKIEKKILKKKLVERQSEHEHLTERLSFLAKENEELSSKISLLREDSVTAKERKIHQQKKLRSIQKKVSEAKSKFASDQVSAVEYEAELSQLELEVKTLRAIILSQ